LGFVSNGALGAFMTLASCGVGARSLSIHRSDHRTTIVTTNPDARGTMKRTTRSRSTGASAA
jgi:hypothetical protein